MGGFHVRFPFSYRCAVWVYDHFSILQNRHIGCGTAHVDNQSGILTG